MAQKYPPDLLSLIAHLKKLPGVGTKTAERFAFELLSWDRKAIGSLSQTLNTFQEKIPVCSCCGCLTDQGNCIFCKNRDQSSLCILSTPREAFAIEETGYRGLYHVIEHLLSPLDGKHASTIKVDRILKRIQDHNVQEVIIAFDSTLEGDTTALFLKNHLPQTDLSISRLAFGLPVGSNLEYIDGSTLARALQGRQKI